MFSIEAQLIENVIKINFIYEFIGFPKNGKTSFISNSNINFIEIKK